MRISAGSKTQLLGHLVDGRLDGKGHEAHLDAAHALAAEVIGVDVDGLEPGVRGLVGQQSPLTVKAVRAAVVVAIGADVEVRLQV